MPYPRSADRITALLPAVLGTPEIAHELEKKAIRRDVIEKETSERVQWIWEAVAARTNAYDATEKTIESVYRRARIPVRPAYLTWVHWTAWILVSSMLLAGLATAVFGIVKGWAVVVPVLTRFATWRTWGLIVANLIVTSGTLLAWHRHRDRLFERLKESATNELNTQLTPYNSSLR